MKKNEDYILGFREGKNTERERILKVLRKYIALDLAGDFTTKLKYIIKGIEKEEIA